MARFIPAKVLKEKYDVFGHFYSVQVAPNTLIECRSVLEIVENAVVPVSLPGLSSESQMRYS